MQLYILQKINKNKTPNMLKMLYGLFCYTDYLQMMVMIQSFVKQAILCVLYSVWLKTFYSNALHCHIALRICLNFYNYV